MSTSHKEEERRIELDILRGIGIFSVLLIHSTVLYYSQPVASFLWDVNQFAVQLLVFCSSYIYFLKEKASEFSFISYFKKRILRLLKPYYVFVIIFFGILLLSEYSNLTRPGSLRHLSDLAGLTDFNWLVLLMLQFAIAFPIITFLKEKFKPGFFLLMSLSILSSAWFLFHKSTINYKLDMWLPWITIAFYSLIFVRFKHTSKFLSLMFLLTLGLFLGLHSLESHLGRSLQMYDNKYPPNLYFLMYGMMTIPFLLLLNNMGIFIYKPVERFLVFMSKNSYTLFFIHFIFLYFLEKYGFVKKLEWLGFFVVLLICTIITQVIINWILRKEFRLPFSKIRQLESF